MTDAIKNYSTIIVEDDARTSKFLQKIIRKMPCFDVRASFERAGPAENWLRLNEPDLMLIDLGLPDKSGTEVIKYCSNLYPSCEILVITIFGDEDHVLAAIEAGATGYLLKDESMQFIDSSIEQILTGGSPMSPLIARKILSRLRNNEPNGQPDIGKNLHLDNNLLISSSSDNPLSHRERDILDLIIRGYSYSEISNLLSISLSTVQTHIKRIYSKLNVNSRSEAVFEAFSRGLIGSIGNPLK